MPEIKVIGTHDLRASCDPSDGWYHVTLEDTDDGDCIIVNEDDLTALRDYLDSIIRKKESICWKCQGAKEVEEPICGHCEAGTFHSSCDDTFMKKVPCDVCKDT